MRISIYMHIACILLLSSCGLEKSHIKISEIPEFFVTESRHSIDLDSVAVWQGDQGQYWLVSTGKTGNVLPVYDAISGSFIKDIGKAGAGCGQLHRPNGIAIVDNLVFITERDNKRMQIFSLPEGKCMGVTYGIMQRPYGIAAMRGNENDYIMYVTDNFNPVGKDEPKRVHIYRAECRNGKIDISFVRTFGDQEGPGALIKVESIAIDKAHNRLIIADEHASQKNLKLYTLNGEFTGQIMGEGLFEFEPEGIAVYETGPETGYIIATDQDRIGNRFYIFDRQTLAHVASFKGSVVRNTDGIALVDKPFGPFKSGAFYAVHDDGNICAYDWHMIAHICGLQGKDG